MAYAEKCDAHWKSTRYADQHGFDLEQWIKKWKSSFGIGVNKTTTTNTKKRVEYWLTIAGEVKSRQFKKRWGQGVDKKWAQVWGRRKFWKWVKHENKENHKSEQKCDRGIAPCDKSEERRRCPESLTSTPSLPSTHFVNKYYLRRRRIHYVTFPKAREGVSLRTLGKVTHYTGKLWNWGVVSDLPGDGASSPHWEGGSLGAREKTWRPNFQMHRRGRCQGSPFLKCVVS